MRYLWLSLLLLPLLLSGCDYPYGPYGGYAGYPYASYPSYGYAPGYGQPYAAAQPDYGGYMQAYGNPAANDPNNCGTPDEPKPCYRRYR